MKERVPCEFFLVRYVPDVVKGEFVNIGVVLRAAGGQNSGSPEAAAQVRFTRDWRRVQCMDAHADVPLLEGLEAELALRLSAPVGALEPRPVMSVLEDTLSNSLQMTAPRASLAESLPAEMEQLMRMYVEPLASARSSARVARDLSGRAGIVRSMRQEFERAGAWASMSKRVPVERYTRRGDPLRIDAGYRSEVPPAIRMFQAVSLASDAEMAKVLAYTAPGLREGVRRVDGLDFDLTAVVEPFKDVAGDNEEGEAGERYRFGVETMERAEIRVVTLNDLARVAATARRELGL